MKNILLALVLLLFPISALAISGEKLKETNSFDAREFKVKGMLADGIISYHDKDEISLNIKGDKDILSHISAYTSDGKLYIVSKDRALNKSVYISARLPKKTKIDLEITGSGDWKMKKVEAPVEVKIKGSGSIHIDDIESTHVEIDITGNGNVFIDKGFIDRMDVNITGSGKVEMDGEVKTASIKLIGEGVISIKELLDGLTKEVVIGKGKIKIKKRAEN